MKESLKNILTIKKLAKIRAIIHIVEIPAMVVLIIIMVITTLHSTPTKTPFGSSIGLIVFFIIFIVSFIALGITSFVFAILLIVNSTSMHVPTKDCKNEEVKEEVKTFKTTALVCSILAIFFGLILDIIIWVISNTKIRFLKEKIKEQKKQEEAKVE